MLNMRKLEGITFYFSIFLISIQLGKHFWPQFAFVNGIRIDYLSPTLYLSDIFVILFIVLHIVNNFREILKLISESILLPLFFVSLLISSFVAQGFDTSIYWSIKAIEMILFAFCVSNFIFIKKSFIKIIDVLVFAAFLQSIIAIFQFIFQSSLGGPLYFLGERSFSVNTIGISTFISNGKEILRAYGTFPHPNVLAFFLSVTLVFAVSSILKLKTEKRVYLYSFLSLPIFLALLLTASRVIIFLTLIVLILLFIKSKKYILYSILGLIIISSLYLLLFSGRFLSIGPIFEAISIRVDLIKVSLKLLNENPLFGVGLNNTFLSTEFNNSLPIYARFQPVHNIYLQIILQIGLFGGLITALFLWRLVSMAKRLFIKSIFPSFVVGLLVFEILIIGLFDHFPVTLQQGMLLTAFLLGLLFNKSMEQELE